MSLRPVQSSDLRTKKPPVLEQVAGSSGNVVSLTNKRDRGEENRHCDGEHHADIHKEAYLNPG